MCVKCAEDNDGDDRLCSVCYTSHTMKTGRFKTHKAEPAESTEGTVLARRNLAPVPRMCLGHPHKEAELLCKCPGCAVACFICILCARGAHKDHDQVPLDQVHRTKCAELMREVHAPLSAGPAAGGVAAPFQQQQPAVVPTTAAAMQEVVESAPVVVAAREAAVMVAAHRAALPPIIATSQLQVDTVRDTMIGEAHNLHGRLSAQLKQVAVSEGSKLEAQQDQWDSVLADGRSTILELVQVCVTEGRVWGGVGFGPVSVSCTVLLSYLLVLVMLLLLLLLCRRPLCWGLQTWRSMQTPSSVRCLPCAQLWCSSHAQAHPPLPSSPSIPAAWAQH